MTPSGDLTCFRCRRPIRDGDAVLEVRTAVVPDGQLTTTSSNRVMHAVCPPNPTQRLN